jgi:glycerol kinase
MGIDEGTGSARTIIFDEEGQTVAEVARELTQYYPRTGWHHHDPKQILHFQLETMRQALKEARLSPQDIRSIGVTNQRETALVWDKASGEPVYNAIVWTSRQSVDIIERWAAEGLSEDILQKTGLPNDAWFSASKIAWVLENVDGAREKAERGELLAGNVDSWLIWNLTGGQRHVTDYSNASRTMLFNIHTLRWDEELCEAFGIPVQMLPEVVSSDADFGSIGPSFGADIPIQGVLGDQQAGLFGQTCFEPGLAKNTLGTAGVYSMNTGSRAAYDRGSDHERRLGVEGRRNLHDGGGLLLRGRDHTMAARRGQDDPRLSPTPSGTAVRSPTPRASTSSPRSAASPPRTGTCTPAGLSSACPAAPPAST